MGTGRGKQSCKDRRDKSLRVFLLLFLLLSSSRAAFAAAGSCSERGCREGWRMLEEKRPLEHLPASPAWIWQKMREVPFLQRQRNAHPGASHGAQHPCDRGGPGAAVPASPSRSSLLN